MRKYILFLLTILVLTTSALAQDTYQLTLLAVQENSDGSMTGSTADLYLELLPHGSGRVFLDTQPATKVDTQISTRFAKEIACAHYELDCNKYDYVYTIKSGSSIIGGPSAGAAFSALTAIAIMDIDYDQSVAVSATINSGGIVGPVGGVSEKISAAQEANLTKVLIAQGAGLTKDNETKDYRDQNFTIQVEEILTLDEVMYHLTGKNFSKNVGTIDSNEEYQQIMRTLQQALCKREIAIEEEINAAQITLNETIVEDINSRRSQAVNASATGDFYSAASFCFGNNIILRRELYQSQNISQQQLEYEFRVLQNKVIALEKRISKEEIETISDLQALMVVQERLQDVQLQIQEFTNADNSTTLEQKQALLAYAQERLYSAISWSQFFTMSGKRYVVDDQLLRQSCYEKILEAEERLQYASLYVLEPLLFNLQEKIDTARKNQHEGKYPLCLITASQAKGDANAILSSFGLRNETRDDFIKSKIHAVENVIAKNSEQGIFPILGYSYYRYAQALDDATTLVYLEYALEMSDLGIYFPQEKNDVEFEIPEEIVLLLEGILIGVLSTYLIMRLKRKPPKIQILEK